MRRAFLLSLIIYGLILAGLIMRNGLVLALSLLFVLYLAASLLGAPALREAKLEIRRTLDAERVVAEMPVEVQVSVTNPGPSLEEVLIEDDLPPGLVVCDGSPRHLLYLPQGKMVTWTYTIRGRRGTYLFSSIRVQARGPLGLVGREQALPTAGQLLILPPVPRLKSVAIRPRRTRVYAGLVPARTGGPGTEFFGVREYQFGDPPHWINWRATARHPATLFSNEFEQERVADVGIVLDGRERANLVVEGRSIFEYSTLAAAALADALLSQGNRVSLLRYGQFLQWTWPGYGKVQRERILRALAQAQLGDSQAFADLDHLPTRLFPAHSQVVLISPLLADDLGVLIRLRARGYQVMIISPDPVGFEASSVSRQPEIELAARVVRMERQLLLQQLRRAGIQVVDWDVDKPFEQVVRGRLDRPPAWLRAVEGPPSPAAGGQTGDHMVTFDDDRSPLQVGRAR